ATPCSGLRRRGPRSGSGARPLSSTLEERMFLAVLVALAGENVLEFVGQQFDPARVVLEADGGGVGFAEPDQPAVPEAQVAGVNDIAALAGVAVFAMEFRDAGVVRALQAHAGRGPSAPCVGC